MKGEKMKNNGKIINKLFRNSVISIILAAIATMIGIVIDGIIIGRFLGEDSMAAYGLVTPIISKELKTLGNFRKGGNKGFDTIISRLQSRC